MAAFEAKWNADLLPIGQSWRNNWSRLTTLFGINQKRTMPFCNRKTALIRFNIQFGDHIAIN